MGQLRSIDDPILELRCGPSGGIGLPCARRCLAEAAVGPKCSAAEPGGGRAGAPRGGC